MDQTRQPPEVVNSPSPQVIKQRMMGSLLGAVEEFLHMAGFGVQSPGSFPTPSLC